jgi:N4-gp56 family major capsid protein
MANTLQANAIAKILMREYERPLTRSYKILPFANRKFEGEVAQKGDTVRVPYVQLAGGWNTGVTDSNRDVPATDMTIGTHNMAIEQYCDIRFKISDKELSLLGKDMGTTQEVVRQLKDLAQKKQEDYFVSKLTGATLAAGNEITGVAGGVTAGNAHAEVEKIVTALDKQNAPEEGRYIFVSPSTASILRQSDLFDGFDARYQKRSSGEVGMIGGAKIVKSTAIADDKMIGYCDQAGNFVEKLNFIKVKEADSGNYYNVVGGLFYDAALLGEGLKKVVDYTFGA